MIKFCAKNDTILKPLAKNQETSLGLGNQIKGVIRILVLNNRCGPDWICQLQKYQETSYLTLGWSNLP
jgi:hypothetical protein